MQTGEHMSFVCNLLLTGLVLFQASPATGAASDPQEEAVRKAEGSKEDLPDVPQIALIMRASRRQGVNNGVTQRRYWTPDGNEVAPSKAAAIVPELAFYHRGFQSPDELRFFVHGRTLLADNTGRLEFQEAEGNELQGISNFSSPIMKDAKWHVYLVQLMPNAKLPKHVGIRLAYTTGADKCIASFARDKSPGQVAPGVTWGGVSEREGFVAATFRVAKIVAPRAQYTLIAKDAEENTIDKYKSLREEQPGAAHKYTLTYREPLSKFASFEIHIRVKETVEFAKVALSPTRNAEH